MIEKFPGANTLEVTRGIEAALRDMAPGLKGISVDPNVYRPATFIQTALHNVGVVGLISFAVLLVLMLVLLGSWRAALIGVIVVPVSLVTAAYVLYLQGVTFTTITLLGLAAAMGLVIDDVITDIDAVPRRLADGGDKDRDGSRNTTLIEAFSTTRGPLVFAALAIMLATLPLLFMGTLVTSFSRPLVLTYVLALLASTLVAFTLTPTLAALLLRGDRAGREGWFAGLAKRFFDRRLAASILRPRRVWAAAAVLAVAALAALPQIGSGSLLPALQDHNLLLKVDAAPGTSLPEMDRITAAASSELRTLPGVKSVGAHVGRAVGSDQLVNVNSAEVWITLAGAADYSRSLAAIKAVMHGYAGLRTDLLTYPSDRVAEVTSGQTDDLVVRVYGPDLGVLQSKAGQVRTMLSGVAGVVNPVVRPIPRQPTVDIQVNLAAAQKYGLKPGDVRRDATTLTSGLIVGNLYEQSKIFDVVVWGAPQTRSDLTRLGNLLIDTPSGGQVALRDVATVTVQPEPTAITHDDVSRTVEVAAKVSGDPGSVVAAVKSRLAGVSMPYEYHAEVFGNATVKRADFDRTLLLGAAALIGVFLLLQAAVGSWRRAGLLLLSLPLSVVGAVLAAPLGGGLWSTGSLAGMFAVLALAIRGGILLGHRISDAEQEDAADGQAAVVDAARARAVPVLQSALTIAYVLVPAAVFGSRAGLEFLHPLAVTMLGGLVSLLVVQLFVLPGLLVMTADRRSAPELDAGHTLVATD